MASKELVAASARPLLLSLLAEEESYGYALIRRVSELSGGNLEWSEGMLYPVLHRLEDEGLIQSRWKRSPDTGRRRKYYRLRAGGKRALAAERQAWSDVNSTLTRLWRSLGI